MTASLHSPFLIIRTYIYDQAGGLVVAPAQLNENYFGQGYRVDEMGSQEKRTIYDGGSNIVCWYNEKGY
jgi:hypothetical protein